MPKVFTRARTRRGVLNENTIVAVVLIERIHTGPFRLTYGCGNAAIDFVTRAPTANDAFIVVRGCDVSDP